MVSMTKRYTPESVARRYLSRYCRRTFTTRGREGWALYLAPSGGNITEWLQFERRGMSMPPMRCSVLATHCHAGFLDALRQAAALFNGRL